MHHYKNFILCINFRTDFWAQISLSTFLNPLFVPGAYYTFIKIQCIYVEICIGILSPTGYLSIIQGESQFIQNVSFLLLPNSTEYMKMFSTWWYFFTQTGRHI